MTLPARLDRLDGALRGVRPTPPTTAEPLRLTGMADVVAVLEEAIHAARTDPTAEPLERARALGSLAAVALKAIEARDLAGRVEALEAVLKVRASGAGAGRR